MRFISAVLMLAAIFTLVADVTRWQIGESVPLFHSLAYHIETLAPSTYARMMEKVSREFPPLVWDYGVSAILFSPAWLVFAFLSVIIAVAGRERQRIDIFIN